MKSEKIIESLSSLGENLEKPNQKRIVIDAILEISRLNDENDSVWSLLEEIKASDVANYKKQIETAIAEKLLVSLASKRNISNETN